MTHKQIPQQTQLNRKLRANSSMTNHKARGLQNSINENPVMNCQLPATPSSLTYKIAPEMIKNLMCKKTREHTKKTF